MILLLFLILIIIIIVQFFIIINKGEKHCISLENNNNKEENNNNNIEENNIFLDKYETHIYEKIREKIEKYKCSQMWVNQKEFLNGVIRKFRPKKIVEIGVAYGGGSSIMLNAIQDIENSHL